MNVPTTLRSMNPPIISPRMISFLRDTDDAGPTSTRTNPATPTHNTANPHLSSGCDRPLLSMPPALIDPSYVPFSNPVQVISGLPSSLQFLQQPRLVPCLDPQLSRLVELRPRLTPHDDHARLA